MEVLLYLAKYSSHVSRVLAISILRNLTFNKTNRPRFLSSGITLLLLRLCIHLLSSVSNRIYVSYACTIFSFQWILWICYTISSNPDRRMRLILLVACCWLWLATIKKESLLHGAPDFLRAFEKLSGDVCCWMPMKIKKYKLIYWIQCLTFLVRLSARYKKKKVCRINT